MQNATWLKLRHAHHNVADDKAITDPAGIGPVLSPIRSIATLSPFLPFKLRMSYRWRYSQAAISINCHSMPICLGLAVFLPAAVQLAKDITISRRYSCLRAADLPAR
jgi:hypothetical protein